MVAYLVALVGVVLAVWLVPSWLLPWLVAIGFVAWVYYCVVQSGYPLVPTVAWAAPVALAMIVGLLGHSAVTQIIGFVGLGIWLTLYAYEPARRPWYVKLFRWRP